MSASIAARRSAGSFWILRVDVADAVVGIDAERLEHGRVLVEDVLVVRAHGVSEHDRIGHLHHRRLEVQRQQDAAGLGVGDLFGEELVSARRLITDAAMTSPSVTAIAVLEDGGRCRRCR